jgi:hypothetical protein
MGIDAAGRLGRLAAMFGAPGSGFQLSRRWRQILLGIASGVSVLCSPAGAIGALVSPLVFDHPGNTLNPVAWLAFLLLIGFWVVCLLAPLGAWWLFRQDREPLAWAVMASPLAWIVLLLAILQFVPG